MSKTNLKIGFIGAGKMATSIASGLAGHLTSCENICAYDVAPPAAELFSQKTGCLSFSSAESFPENLDVIFLAVKPQFVETALSVPEIKSRMKGKLLISIAAGVKLSSLVKNAGTKKIVRVMPNTPALVKQSMSCFACNEFVSSKEKDLVVKLLSSFGLAREVPETMLDAVTGLSGSGPAFVIEFILALAEGGVYCGMPRTLALDSAIQTVLGTAEMVKSSPESVYALRDAVITPNGTTARGLHVLDEKGFRGIVKNCVIAAAERSFELGKK